MTYEELINMRIDLGNAKDLSGKQYGKLLVLFRVQKPRNTRKALMLALLEPVEKLKETELSGDFTSRLALLEEYKMYPAGAVWDYYCSVKNIPAGEAWLEIVKEYERNELSKRS